MLLVISLQFSVRTKIASRLVLSCYQMDNVIKLFTSSNFNNSSKLERLALSNHFTPVYYLSLRRYWGSGWKTTLLTSVFFVLTSIFFTSWCYADGFLQMLIQMFADVRWVGFLPPVFVTCKLFQKSFVTFWRFSATKYPFHLSSLFLASILQFLFASVTHRANKLECLSLISF